MRGARRPDAVIHQSDRRSPPFDLPICWQHTALHVAMKTAVRPIGDARHKAMLYRIVVDVVDVPFEILLIAKDVLPTNAAPKFPFRKTARPAPWGAGLISRAARCYFTSTASSAEPLFRYNSPADRLLRPPPNHMDRGTRIVRSVS